MIDEASPNHTSEIVNKTAAPSCPVGEKQCEIIDQVVSLREEVDHLNLQVRTDTLTQLFNFRHFQESLAQEMERTRRSSQPTALIVLDLDFFKKVNDTWGHEVGNQALVSTAKIIKTSVRRLDIACRYGGEEFSIILPSTDLITSIHVAERLRFMIETTPVLVGDKDIGLTASLGVDVYSNRHDDTPEQFVKRVDSLLYRAKENGRNQSCSGTLDLGNVPAAVSAEERDLLAGFFGAQEYDDSDEPESLDD